MVGKGNFKLQFSLDEETKDFDLKVANPNPSNKAKLDPNLIVEYDKLPLKALSEEGKEGKEGVPTIEGIIKFNSQSIIQEYRESAWSPDLMQLWIDRKCYGDLIQDIHFEGVKCSSGVMSELLDLTL